MPARSSLALLALVGLVGIASTSVAAGSTVVARPAPSAAPVWSAPSVDLAEIEREDRLAVDDPGRPYRAGLSVPVGVGPADAGRWSLEADGLSWSLALRSAGARWTALTVGHVELPDRVTLRVRDAAGQEVAALHGPRRIESWRTPPARGERLELRLEIPAGESTDDVSLLVEQITHGYRGLFERRAAGGGAGACNVDVSCPLAGPLADQRRGVVKLLIDAGAAGLYLCSGSLINTTANDCRPYVLTADHCYEPGGGAATTTFIFNYELPACGGGSTDESLFVFGGSEVARWSDGDMRLVEMDIAPPDAWKPFYLGWNRSPSAASSAWTVHHPSGDVKKISRDAGPVVNGIVEADHWRVANWEQGTTEGGSSGAPLIDQDLRIVGQLDFGTASCATPGGWDEFGKLSDNWTGGPNPADRLEPWLDPVGSGAMAIDGLDQSACSAGTLAVRDGETLDDRLGNGDGRLHPGEIAALALRLANRGIAAATAVTAVLTSPDPRVVVRESIGAWDDLPPLSAGNPSLEPQVEIELDPSLPCGANVSLALAIESDQGQWNEAFELPTGTTVGTEDSFFDDVEGGTAGWSQATLLAGTSNPWVTTTADSHSAGTSWFVPNLSARRDTVLRAPSQVSLPPGAMLRFWQRMESENGFDGGVLELSTDGAAWFDAAPWIVEGAYNGAISTGFNSTLAGRDAWTGDIGWQRVSIDLSSFEGETIDARWRFALDNFGAALGWFVDDVQVEFDRRVCPSPWVNRFPGARCSGALDPRDPSRPPECGRSRPRLRHRP